MPGDKKYRPAWIRHSGIGIEFAAAVAGFGLVGYWIDRHYKTDPWGVVIGAALGLVGATYNLVRESLAAFKEVGDEDRDEDRPVPP
ncbi:MAG: AtpZ/AtpI family protein [Planctomycetota bacterium]|jgi:F0F1-type ATP synthase assembly protein I